MRRIFAGCIAISIKIVCVSKAGKRNFQKKSGLSSEKIEYVYNTLRSDSIRSKAQIPIELVLEDGKNKTHVLEVLEKHAIKFVSSGRFAEQKRFDRVIQTAKRLKTEKVDFCWLLWVMVTNLNKLKKQLEKKTYLMWLC